MSRLGVFDSGLGGYDIVRAIHRQYPKQDIVLLADQKNVPYGNKDSKELEEITRNNLAFFKKKRIGNVLIACNTTSANAVELEGVNAIRIIGITSAQVEESRVIVLATKHTCNSHAYQKAMPEKEVIEIPLANMASLIERLASKEEILAELDANLHAYKDSGIPAVLGCTHYPIIKEEIEVYLQSKSYTSIPAVLQLPLYSRGRGRLEIYTNAKAEELKRKIKVLFDDDVEVKEI